MLVEEETVFVSGWASPCRVTGNEESLISIAISENVHGEGTNCLQLITAKLLQSARPGLVTQRGSSNFAKESISE